jgi:hypothetical protein
MISGRRSPFGLVSVAVALWCSSATAYPWMIKHGEAQCSTCHLDPSGGGLLTDYGRGQSEVLLRSQYYEDDALDQGDFMFGAVTLPDWLFVSTNIRAGGLATRTGDSPVGVRPVVMATDLRVGVEQGALRGAASVGYTIKGAARAALTHGAENVFVSREHWVGYAFGANNKYLLRGGRMNMPFGLRNLEHTSFVRSVTRTDTNVGQQHGVSLAHDTQTLRAELMLVAGNFQVNPDSFRERGYAGFVERRFGRNLAAGFSSQVLHARRDIELRYTRTRTAHGPFVRYAPVKWLTLLAEADYLLSVPRARDGIGPLRTASGFVAFAQADVEPWKGLHFMLALEGLNHGMRNSHTQLGGMLSTVWFFAPHADLRLDLILRHAPGVETSPPSATVVAQLHFFL